ncbi:putative ribonuclease T2 [Thermoascus aurantiacus ATCC 26904]
MPSSRSAAALALGAAAAQLFFAGGALADVTSCSLDSSQLSCHNTSKVTDTCCFNSPGGLLLQTQFWDTDPATGPSDSWTIHGLWPDNCDGTYASNCDPSREYSNITAILRAQGRTELLDYMQTYWKDDEGDDEGFWEHEWNKHGTCINTIEPSCYTDYYPQEEVGDFFQKVVDLFQGLDTYKALAAAGITPSSSKTYRLSELQDAISQANGGHTVMIGCDGNRLNEVWYYFNVRGNAITGTYVATDSGMSCFCKCCIRTANSRTAR